MSALARRLAVAAAVLAATPAFAAKKPLAPTDRIDLNRASLSELMRLPGVGQKKAQAIVTYRQRSPFRRPEDVMMVRGCGRPWFQKVKGNLVVAAPGPAAAPGAAPAAAPAAATAKR